MPVQDIDILRAQWVTLCNARPVRLNFSEIWFTNDL